MHFCNYFDTFCIVCRCNNHNDSNRRKNRYKKAASFNTVKIENQLIPQKDENGYRTFTTDKNFKVLHLTDVHIGGGWMSIDEDAKTPNTAAAMVTAEKPDLVIVTGVNIKGRL